MYYYAFAKLFLLVIVVPNVFISNVDCYSISKTPKDVHFYFHKDTSTEKEIKFRNAKSVDSAFSSKKPTIVIIHGFWSTKDSEMPTTLTKAYLKSKLQANIIVVDWGKLVNSASGKEDEKVPAFLDALKNVPIVAERIADFLMWLKKLGHLKYEKLHLVGHSLGAHTAGLVGSIIKLRIGRGIKRISGLDPAGPGFEASAGIPDFKNFGRKLNRNDAEFVDAYHSGIGVKGDSSRDGHVDFYPNGGIKQPGCPEDDIFGTCEHAIVVDYFAKTITGQKWKACKCVKALVESGKVSECMGLCKLGTTLAGQFVPTKTRGEYHFSTE